MANNQPTSLDHLFEGGKAQPLPPDFLGDVIAFHEKFGVTYDGKPRILPGELAAFRAKFLQEELNEWVENHRDYPHEVAQEEVTACLESQLDALVDLMYVLLGTAYLQGLTQEKFFEAWRRVQGANMSKVRCERPEDSKRGSTFDIIKPEGWVAPSHADLVMDHAHK